MTDRRPATTWPVALTIAGSDSSGGAGIQADLKTFAALGVYGASVITAITAQNTAGVRGVETVSPGMVAAQLRAVLDDLDVGAIKTGMLASAAIIGAVAAGLRGSRKAIVVDPVMVATSGHALLEPDAVASLRRDLLPIATLVTPNLAEAAALTGMPIADTTVAMAMQGQKILADGPAAVLVKGGHGAGPKAVDVLVTPAGATHFEAPRIATNNTHGTGCTLSAAIAARLARGDSLEAAIRAAKQFLTGALAAAAPVRLGAGHGPVDHFWAMDSSCNHG